MLGYVFMALFIMCCWTVSTLALIMSGTAIMSKLVFHAMFIALLIGLAVMGIKEFWDS